MATMALKAMMLLTVAALYLSSIFVQGNDVALKLDAEGILELDEAMYKDVTKPDPIMKKVIMNNMLTLYLSLDKIYETLQEAVTTDHALQKVVEEVHSKGGLKIVNLKQEDEKLMKAYDWDEDRTVQLRRNLERASEMWRNILELLKITGGN